MISLFMGEITLLLVNTGGAREAFKSLVPNTSKSSPPYT